MSFLFRGMPSEVPAGTKSTPSVTSDILSVIRNKYYRYLHFSYITSFALRTLALLKWIFCAKLVLEEVVNKQLLSLFGNEVLRNRTVVQGKKTVLLRKKIIFC